MTISMHQAAVAPLLRQMGALLAIIEKAEAHCAARKIDPQALLTARLYPDMFTFTRQVQTVSDTAKGLAARLAGIEVPSMADTETSFAELKARLQRTIDFVKSVPREKIDGSEGREIVLMLGGSRRATFTGIDFLLHSALPNFFFHVATAYDILRHNGVELAKRDYLGA